MSKPKFKIGDKVQLINNRACSINRVGDIGIVVNIETLSFSSHKYKYRINAGRATTYNWSAESDLKLFKINWKERLE